MRCGHIEQAVTIGKSVSKAIHKQTSSTLKVADFRNDTKTLWDQINKHTKKPTRSYNQTGLSAEDLNNFFAASSLDPGYIKPMRKTTANHEICTISESIVFKVLDGLHHTAEGADGLPAWYLRLVGPGFSGILVHLINMSLDGAFVPTQWKTAVIRPKAKVAAPKTPADYRPISVLPILSRVVERFIVQRFIYLLELSTVMRVHV